MPAIQAPPSLPPCTAQAVDQLVQRHSLSNAQGTTFMRISDANTFSRYRRDSVSGRRPHAIAWELLLLRVGEHPTHVLAWRDRARTDPHPERDLPELPPSGPDDVRALADRHRIDAHDGALLLRLPDYHAFNRYLVSGASGYAISASAWEMLLLALDEHPTLRLVSRQAAAGLADPG